MGKKRYYHFALDKSAWLSLALSLLSILVDIYGNFKNMNILVHLSFVFFLLAVILFFVVPMRRNKKVIDDAYDNHLLDRAIAASIDGAKQDAEKDKYSHFLREITQADRLNPLKLEIDDSAFDDIFDLTGTLSITEAPLFAWKNPEYSWFLITHYASTLLHRIEREGKEGSPSVITITDRKDDSCNGFFDRGIAFLQMAALSTDKSFALDDYVRFYLLNREEIEDNVALCEQLVAGHELFGVHLFIIDKEEVFKIDDISRRFKSLKTIGIAPNSILDLMVYQCADGQIGYNIGENGRLTSKRISSSTKRKVHDFIRDLSKELLENEHALIYPCKEAPYQYNMDDICLNEKKSFLKVVNHL